MAVTVRIPTPLQQYTGNSGQVQVSASTVEEAVSALGSAFPSIQERICDENGRLRRFVNLYVNDEDVRFLEGEKTPLQDGDEVSIIPAIAGG